MYRNKCMFLFAFLMDYPSKFQALPVKHASFSYFYNFNALKSSTPCELKLFFIHSILCALFSILNWIFKRHVVKLKPLKNHNFVSSKLQATCNETILGESDCSSATSFKIYGFLSISSRFLNRILQLMVENSNGVKEVISLIRF